MSIEEQKLDIANKFTQMCNFGLDKFHSGMTVKLFRSLVDIKCKLQPLWFIEITGPFFFKFRNEIMTRDINFFIDRDYWDQRNDWMQITQGYGESVARAFEASAKSSLAELVKTEPKALAAMPISLINLYSRYVLLCQSADK